MAATFKWKIPELQSNKYDGYVYNVTWYVEAWDGNDSATKFGDIKLPKPSSGMIAYNSLTESQVVNWVKDKLGASKVNEIEKNLQVEIDDFKLQKINVTETNIGIPWDDRETTIRINSNIA